MTDNVNHPKHYTQGNIEFIDAIEAALSNDEFIGFLRGQIIKYIWRMGHKGARIQDVQKAIWYARKLEDFLVQLEKRKLYQKEMEALEKNASAICEVLDTEKGKPFPKMFYANVYKGQDGEVTVGDFYDDLSHCEKVGGGSRGRINIWVERPGEYYINLYKTNNQFGAGVVHLTETGASDFKHDESYIKTIRFSV